MDGCWFPVEVLLDLERVCRALGWLDMKLEMVGVRGACNRKWEALIINNQLQILTRAKIRCLLWLLKD